MAYLIHQKARKLAFFHPSASPSSSSEELQNEDSISAGHSKRHIKRIDATAPLKQLITALEQDGCVIINDFAKASNLDAAMKDLEPWLRKQLTASHEKSADDDSHAWTVTGLLRHSSTLREEIFSKDVLQSLIDSFLTLRTRHYLSTKSTISTVEPALSAATSVSLKPGFSAQPLHRSDAAYHAQHTKASSYTIGRDVSLTIFIPTSDSSASTSAPRVLLGSHLWGDAQPKFDEHHDVVTAEMEKGDVLVTLGSLYQGLGGFQNPRSGEKGSREQQTLFVISCVNGVTRPEDEDLMRLDDEEMEGWGKVARRRLGR